ncbi:hypothetical protein DH2020_035458 [Rehmannia glutinosa]|uniref:Growth-regulating factor n=1 Tax=Rehmannia glutinosa TaxID=99300 RepID=A0ABR0V6D5_REHGL
MDFGLVGLDNLSNTSTAPPNNGLDNGAEANDKQKWYGFGVLKQERAINEDDFRDFKMAKICSGGEQMLKIPSLQRSNQQMLSFSSHNPETVALPYYHHTSSGFGRNTGYGSTGINAANLQQGVLSGIRGPFTPSQWMELEHQALIYKYITANVPIPSYLLNPIRKAFESAGFSTFSGLRSNPLGWGAFHLGFSSTDPEPGQAAIVQESLWKASLAIPPPGPPRLMAAAASSRQPLLPPRQRLWGPQAVVHPTVSWGIISTDTTSLDNISKSRSQRQRILHHETSQCIWRIIPLGIGLVCSDSLLNPLNRSSSLVNSRNYGHSDNLNDQENKSHHPLRQFMDDWPKNQSDIDPDRTQLSISIPMVTSDFLSSTSSPTNEKISASPLRLSRELEMGLGVGPTAIERNPRQTTWVPISWEPSMGGPLGEVLHTTSNTTGECKNTKPLNLIDSWDNSPRLASSPTGFSRGARLDPYVTAVQEVAQELKFATGSSVQVL